MIFISGPTLVRPKQIRLTELFTVERVLASRGFRVVSEGAGLDTVLPRNDWPIGEANLVFEVFDNRSKRAELLAFVNDQSVLVADNDVKKLINISGFNTTREAFSHTFEWYAGELLIRRFGAFSSSYSVNVADVMRNSDGETSGDYDVLSVLGTMDVLYLECKSGKFKGKKILNMVERARSLHVSASVMFVESLSETSLKDQIGSIHYPGLPASPALCKAQIKGIPESEIYR